MNAIRISLFCAFLLHLPGGVGQTPTAEPDAAAGNQEAAATAESAGTDEAAADASDETDVTPTDVSAEATEPDEPPAETPAGAPATSAPAATPTTQSGPDFSVARAHLVIVKDGLDAGSLQAPGFSISDQGHVLAYASAVRARDTYLVTVSGGQVFTAELLEKDDETGLMLLRVTEDGHGLSALKFATTAPVVAAPLYAVRFDPAQQEPFAPVAGTVSRLPEEDGEVPFIVHNALFNVAAAGAPLLNRCYQAVGVNALQQTGFPSRTLDPEEQGSAVSLAAHSLNVFLASANLALPLDDSECLSLAQETRQRLEQVEREKAAALQAQQVDAEARALALAEEAQRKEEELNREKQEVQQQLEQARQEKETALQAERQQAEAEKRRLEEAAQQRLEQAQQENEQALQAQRQEKEQALAAQRQETELARQQAGKAARIGRQILLYSLVFVLASALVFFFVMRARRKRLQGVEQEKRQAVQALDKAQAELSDASEREQARAGAPDVFIEGVTPQDERIALKIPGVSLVEPEGATVGRSPAESAFVINHEQVSRRHFRLLLVSRQLMVEDLGSTNGTTVNGLSLSPGVRQTLEDGSRLQTGNLELTVRIGV